MTGERVVTGTSGTSGEGGADAGSAQLPHHDGSALYVSNAAPELGETVRVRLRVPADAAPLASVRVRANPNHEPRWSDARRIGSADGWDWWEAEFEVENPVHGYRWLLVGADGGQRWLNQLGLSSIEVRDVDDFRLTTHPPAPEWAAESVLYQVFPDRFARSAAADERATPEWAIAAEWGDPVDPVPPGRSQQLYGGDLDGVREHLDHLAALGVNLLYLTPVFPARSNHRYDASSFDRVDELLGGDEALVRLIEAAHERGIRVIGDLTTNHSGDAHEWFRTALADPASPERGFYAFRADGEYEAWLGVPSLPKFDWSSAELRRRFIDGPDSVVAKYLAAPYGLDGWRIDVANMTGRLGAVDLNEEVRRTIRRTMLDVNPDTVLIAESTNDAASDLTGDAWHGAMSYAPFTRPVWSWLQQPGSPVGGGIGFAVGRVPSIGGAELVRTNTEFTAGYPWRLRLTGLNALDTHDTPRFLTHARPGTLPVAFGLAVALPGMPVVWAGDEFGLTGEDGEASRTPIPWGAEPAELERYRELVALRRAHPALQRGGLRWLHAEPDAVAFVRETAEETLLVVAARDDAAFELAVDAAGAVRRFGDALLTASAAPDGPAHAHVAVDGPAFAVWSLPGVSAPAW